MDSASGSNRSCSNRTLCISFGLLVVVYVSVWLALPNGFWINDNGCKFIQMEGLVRTQYLQLAIPWPGRDFDRALAYNPLPLPFGQIRHGQLYGYYSDVFALVTSFAYRAFGFKGITLIPLLSGLLLLCAIWRIAGLLPGRRYAQPLSLVVAALCTPVMFYSMTYWEHITAAACMVWSIFFRLRRCPECPRLDAVISACLCGMAIYFRDELLLFALALTVVPLVYSVKHWKTHLLFACVVVITLAPFWFVNVLTYGNILGKHLGTSALAGGLVNYFVERWHVFRVLLINGHDNLLVSLVVSAPFIILLVWNPFAGRLSKDRTTLVLGVIASVCGIVFLGGQLQSSKPIWSLLSSNAMFVVSPVLIFAFLHQSLLKDMREGTSLEKQLWSIIVLFMLAYIVITPGGAVAGIHWGCRFWLPVYAILSICAASRLGQWWEAGVRTAPAICSVVLAIVLSFGAQVYSMKLLYERKAFSARLNECVAASPDNVVIAIGWHLPQDLAMNFYTKRIFLANSRADVDRLIQLMIQKGIPQVQLVSVQPLQMPNPVVVDDGLNFSRIEIHSLKLF